MTDLKGKLNIYTCRVCRGHVVTVDKDAEVTPFMIDCQMSNDCKGTMESSMYRVFDQKMKPDFEWYAPTEDEYVPDHSLSHVSKGGLLLRPYTGGHPS